MRHFLTHCRLNELPHTIYWKILISILVMSGYVIKIFLEKNGWTICKHWRPWSDATFCGIWSGYILFANYPFRVSRLKWVKPKTTGISFFFFFFFLYVVGTKINCLIPENRIWHFMQIVETISMKYWILLLEKKKSHYVCWNSYLAF